MLLIVLANGCTDRSRTEAIRAALDPHVQSLLSDARDAIRQGAYDRALALADSVERYVPDFADVYFHRGEVYLAVGRYDAAREAFEKVLSLDDAYPGAREKLGDVAARQGRPDAALNWYRQEAARHPDAALFERIGQMSAEAGDAEAAAGAYEEAITLDSTSASAYMLYGQLLEQLGDAERALEYSRKAVSLDPNNLNYKFAVGAQLYQQGELEASVEFLRAAADGQLLHYPAQHNLGNVLLRLGRKDEAQRYFARADTARILMDQINQVEQAIARAPGWEDYWNQLGELYRRAEMPLKAADAFATALRLNPLNADAQHGLAKLAMAQGNATEAIRRYKLMLLADPSRTDARLGLGLAQADAGNCAEALNTWNEVLQREPQNTTARRYLAGRCTLESN